MNQPEFNPLSDETRTGPEHESEMDLAETPSEMNRKASKAQSELERRLRAHTDSLPLAVMQWLPKFSSAVPIVNIGSGVPLRPPRPLR